MSTYIMTFGGAYNMLVNPNMENNQHKYYFIDYGDTFKTFECGLHMYQDNINIGSNIPKHRQKGSIYFPHLENEFKKGNTIKYRFNNKTYSIDDIIQIYFERIRKELDENRINEPVDKFLVVVPIDYNKNAKTRLKNIITKAGIPHVEFIEEPIVSYYGSVKENNSKNKSNYFISVNLGGHSLKVQAFKKINNSFTLLDYYYYSSGLDVINEDIKDYILGGKVDTSKWNNEDLVKLNEAISDIHHQFETDEVPVENFLDIESHPDGGYDYTITYEDYLNILNNSMLFKQLQDGITKCVKNNTIYSIDCVAYSGWGCRIKQLQKKANEWCQVDQSIVNCEDVIINGAFKYPSYEFFDDNQRIGITSKGKFIDLLSYNVGSYIESSKAFPVNKPMKLGIFSGYKGMGIIDCHCLGIISFNPSQYPSNNQFRLAISANKEIKAVIYDKSNGTRAKVEKLDSETAIKTINKEEEK